MTRGAAVVLFISASSFSYADDLPITIARIGGPVVASDEPLVPSGNGVLFQSTGQEGTTVWRSDGTVASTHRLRVPGYGVYALLGHLGGRVFLQANKLPFGSDEVVCLDENSGRVTRIRRGYAPAALAASTESGLYFVTTFGPEPGLYRTDGTSKGTRRIFSGEVVSIVSIGKEAIFWSIEPGSPTGARLYRTGAATVQPLADFPSPGRFTDGSRLGAFGNHAAFWMGFDLWVTDGTPGGTITVDTGSADSAGSCRGQLLFFKYSSSTATSAAWTTDGTIAGTRLLSSSPGEFVDDLFGVADAGDVCYFATFGFRSVDLWKTDLTATGTVAVTTIVTDNLPSGSVGARGRVYFLRDRLWESELWVSDGTETGTRVLQDRFGRTFAGIVRARNNIFFHTFEDDSSTPLWAAELPPALSLEDAVIRERPAGVAFMRFVLRLSRPAGDPIVVDYATEPGTAESGLDYEAVAGTARFAPGQRTKIIRVPILGDPRPEGKEQFVLRLSNPVGAEIERGVAIGTIGDATAQAQRLP